MRKRNCEWKTRLTEKEYQRLVDAVNRLGITKQEYGEKALFRQILLTKEDQKLLQNLLQEASH